MSERATIEAAGPRGMVTVRGDLASVALKNAVSGVVALDFPDVRRCAVEGARGLAWMSPDELLLMLPPDEVANALTAMRAALAGEHHLLADVSDARAVFRIAGAPAREVLARLAPVDMAPEAFGPGDFRRTRLAQVPVAFWMTDAQAFDLMCFRSVAGYVQDVLATAASGEEIGIF